MSDEIKFDKRQAAAGMVHLAGELIEGVQRCTICGGIISDYRDAAIQEGTPQPTGFPIGFVTRTKDGHGWFASSDPELPYCTPPSDGVDW